MPANGPSQGIRGVKRRRCGWLVGYSSPSRTTFFTQRNDGSRLFELEPSFSIGRWNCLRTGHDDGSLPLSRNLGCYSAPARQNWTQAQLAAEERRRNSERERQREEEERLRPAREAAEAKRREEEARRDAERRRANREREDARIQCELLYDRYRSELETRFPRSMLDGYITRYLGDDRPLEDVRQRASQLQELLQSHVDRVEPPRRFSTIEDLTMWFIGEKKRIEHLDVDEIFKQTYLTRLSERYAEIADALLSEPQP
ncbi:MAG: hypothetical protein U1D30_06730 [Planctomycetota bacterium]